MLSDAPYFFFHIFISRESKVGAVHMAEIMILNAGDGTAGADDAAGRQEKARALLAEGTALWATRRAMGDGLWWQFSQDRKRIYDNIFWQRSI